MSKLERKIEDLCDVTPTLFDSEPQAASQLTESFNDPHRSQKVDHRGACGTCNVCSAPCSSCSHVDKFQLKSSHVSTKEVSADNIVLNEVRRYESGQTSELSNVGVVPASNSFSEDVIGKASSSISEASASDEDDNTSRSRHRVTEGHDDCFSCSTTDEHTSKKHEDEENIIKYRRHCNFSRESPHEVAPKLSTELCSEAENPMKSMDDASELLKGQNQAAKENEKDYAPSGSKDERDSVCCDPPVVTSKSVTKNEDLDMEVPHTDKVQDLDTEIPQTNEGEDSVMKEWDVNLCDICGDAGKEHLLAICSRCNEGAEHTYCMRKRLDKVPEGEWLCEECTETVANERKDKIRLLDENDKGNIFGQPTTEQGNRTHPKINNAKTKIKPPGKRSRDDSGAEITKIVKKPTIEQTVGSPKGKTFPSAVDNSKNQNKRRLQSLRLASTKNVRGTFSKSNSFNSLDSKWKLVDHVVLQRQKSSVEHAIFRPKDGAPRSLGKSSSLKSTMSSCPESEIKLLSPRLAQIQDKRNIKDLNSFERQRAFRSGQPLDNLTIGASKSSESRFDKIASSTRESSSPNSLTNQRQKNLGTADGKSVPTVSRSSSFVAQRTTGSSSGEFKRPPIRSHSTVGVSSANATKDIGPKSVHTALHDDISCSVASESAPSNSNFGVSNILARVRDISTSSERLMESVKLPKDGARKLGVCRKDAVLDHSDATCSIGKDLSISNVEPIEKNILSGNSIATSCAPSLRSAFGDDPVAAPFLSNSTAIPEHEFIWQGSFEIHRGGRTFELWDGIQAHLSTCASSKVVDAVNTFESRLVLYEVPRLSIWPIQFHDHGVREDNIAIFFFAKDIASYNRNYKGLVDNLMKNDLALRGNVNGADLLIFPSSQLPDNMKRWNMLFFIWGVFRGKRGPLAQQIPSSSSLSSATEDIPQAIMSIPESRCSFVPPMSKLSESDDAVKKVRPTCQLGESPGLVSSKTSNFPQEGDMRPLVEDIRSSSTCHKEKDTPVDQRNSSELDLNTAAGNDEIALEEGIVKKNSLDSTSNIVQSSTVKEDGDSSKVEETSLGRKGELRDLNLDPETVISTEKNKHLDSCDTPHSSIGGTNVVLMRNREAYNEPSGALERTTLPSHTGHLPSVSHNHDENPERHLFLVESSPWKVRGLEKDHLHNKVPNLELDLGAEDKNLLIQPLLGVKTEEAIFVEPEKKANVDDESASLSLSLSFPFPETEQRSEPGQLPGSDRKPVNKKTLLSL